MNFRMTLKPLVLTAIWLPPLFSAAGEARFQTCTARWSDEELVIANSHVERKWRIENGLLTAVSFKDLAAKVEWIAKPAKRPAPLPAAKVPKADPELNFTSRSGRLHPLEHESLLVEASTTGSPRFSYRFQIFPDARGVQMTFSDDLAEETPAASDKPSAGTPTGIETNPTAADMAGKGDSLEDLLLAPRHLRFTQVILKDQTDHHNELVFENEWLLTTNEGPIELAGNVFFVEDTMTRAGLIFLKQAPLPHARPVKSEWDAQMLAGERRLRFAGQGYPFVLLAYSGGRTGRIAALQIYQRQLRSYDPKRDGMFLSNTWGDRSRDARINEEFILKEIEAGARLGVDVVQIDDGWQKGRTANSASGKGAWNGYWAADPDFWQPDPKRFPNGIDPVVKAAREKGMKFGLWFGPDTSDEGANWQKDADRLLELHRENGVDYFKLDSVKAVNRHTEENFHKFLDRVLRKSDGRVVFDLDVTAEIRPGYFGAPNVGPIFVENRYTDWGRYWPHQTLRNLWKLSQYVDPLRLRMEFLNNRRNPDQYQNDPLSPAKYRPDTLFATVMFSNPLGWFECSNLPPDDLQSVSKLANVWKQERARMFDGTLLPIGGVPDGHAWTGFASAPRGPGPCFVLLFRELNPAATWSLDLDFLATLDRKVTVLAGQGEANIQNGRLSASIPEPLHYLWLRLD
jgi:alpha-galactosidase